MLDYLAQLARHGRIDPLEYYVSDAHRAVYVENAKVACTAIKAAMYSEEFAAADTQEDFHAALRSRAVHALPQRANRYLVFTFVRHPLARLQSCYRDKVKGEASAGNSSILHRRFHRSIFAAWGGVDIRRGDLPFNSFAEAVSHIPDRISDRHFAGQARIVRAVESAGQSFVGRMERLEEDWAHVRTETGLPALRQENRSSAPRDIPATDAVTRGLVARRFADDFRILGYER